MLGILRKHFHDRDAAGQVRGGTAVAQPPPGLDRPHVQEDRVMVMATWDGVGVSTRGEAIVAPAAMLRGIARGIRRDPAQARRRHDRRKAAAQLLTMDRIAARHQRAPLGRACDAARSRRGSLRRDPAGREAPAAPGASERPAGALALKLQVAERVQPASVVSMPSLRSAASSARSTRGRSVRANGANRQSPGRRSPRRRSWRGSSAAAARLPSARPPVRCHRRC